MTCNFMRSVVREYGYEDECNTDYVYICELKREPFNECDKSDCIFQMILEKKK